MNEEKNTPTQEQNEANITTGITASDVVATESERLVVTKQELFKMILGGYIGMLPAFLAMLATLGIVILIVIFVWGA